MTMEGSPMQHAILGDIDRRAMADWPEIMEQYIARPRPVVIVDAARHWPALQHWTPEFFGQRYPQVGRALADGRHCTMAQYAELMRGSTPQAPAPYPFSFDMRKTFPELIADVRPAPRIARLDRLGHPLLPRSLLGGTIEDEIFFGGDGSVFPVLHFDALCLHTHITQICGHKEFLLFPPKEAVNLYPGTKNPKFSEVNVVAPDLQRHPRFAQAGAWRAELAPGETIFFPAGWWHYTRIRGACISYGGVGLDHSNWQAFVQDNLNERGQAGVRRWKRLGLAAYGRLLGSVLDLQERCMRARH